MFVLPQTVEDQLDVIGSIERSLAIKGLKNYEDQKKLLNKLKSFLYLYRKPFDDSDFRIFVEEFANLNEINLQNIKATRKIYQEPKKVLNLRKAINLKENQILESEVPFHFNAAFNLLNSNYKKFAKLNHWENYHSEKSYILNHLFNFHGNDEEFKKAINIFDQIIDANDNIYIAYLFRALSNFHLRRNFDEIEEDIRRADFLSTPRYVLNNVKAYYVYNLGRLDQAIKILKETKNKWPDYFKTYFNLGIISLDEGFYDESMEHLNKSMRLNSLITSDASYLLAIANLKKNGKKNIDLSIKLLIDAINFDPGNINADLLRMKCQSAKGIIFTKRINASEFGFRNLRRGFYNL